MKEFPESESELQQSLFMQKAITKKCNDES